jgi:hypothetical protein
MGSIASVGAGVILTLMAFAIAGAGAFLNFKGAHFMVPGAAGEVVAGAAVVAEFVKTFWLTGLNMALSSRQVAAAMGVLVLSRLLKLDQRISTVIPSSCRFAGAGHGGQISG